MTKETFKNLLIEVSAAALKFAENYLSDTLVNEFKYSVVLNASNDSPRLTQFDIYPEDTGIVKNELSFNEVVDLLCRNNKVPVWIDINVAASHEQYTTLKLLCSGRYSDNNNEFYYYANGTGPFGIKSPPLPLDYKEGQKFTLQKQD